MSPVILPLELEDYFREHEPLRYRAILSLIEQREIVREGDAMNDKKAAPGAGR